MPVCMYVCQVFDPFANVISPHLRRLPAGGQPTHTPHTLDLTTNMTEAKQGDNARSKRKIRIPSIIRVRSEHSYSESSSGREGIAMQGLSYLQREVRLFKPRKVVHGLATTLQACSQSLPACCQGAALTPGNIAAHF